MSDGRLDIDTRINTDEAGKELQKLKSDVKKTTDDLTKSVSDYARKNEEALKKSIEALGVEARAKGQSLSAQDRYNVALRSYIDLINKSNGKIKEGDPIAQKRLAALKKEKEAIDATTKKHKSFGDTLKAASPQLSSFNSNLQSIAAGGGALAVAIAAHKTTRKPR